MTNNHFILLCFLTLSLIAPSAHAAAFDVYLLAGQSNMDGRGNATDLEPALQKPNPHVLIWYRNPPADSAAWKPLAPGFSIPPKHKTGLPSPTFGPEIGFAKTLLEKNPQQRIGIIKGSKGGTSIEQWSPGTDGDVESRGICYKYLMETITMAKAALQEQGHTMTIRAILWHQGESNSKNSTEEYQNKLLTLISRFREDLQLPDLPFFVGEVFDNGKRDSVRAAQKALPHVIKHVYFVSADGLTTHDSGTHFDAKSQLEIGKRFADAWLTCAK